jgi:hypothetical protein
MTSPPIGADLGVADRRAEDLPWVAIGRVPPVVAASSPTESAAQRQLVYCTARCREKAPFSIQTVSGIRLDGYCRKAAQQHMQESQHSSVATHTRRTLSMRPHCRSTVASET